MKHSSITTILASMYLDPGPTARTPYPWEVEKEDPPNPRPEEVNLLSKRQKKIYCKVLKETQDRELAMKKAMMIKPNTDLK